MLDPTWHRAISIQVGLSTATENHPLSGTTRAHDRIGRYALLVYVALFFVSFPRDTFSSELPHSGVLGANGRA